MRKSYNRKRLRTSSQDMTRRAFLQVTGAAGLAAAVTFPRNVRAASYGSNGPRRLVYVALDGLHPAYLELSARGDMLGSPGNWLMPNVHRFLARSTWYPRALDYLPAATDMNHVNAVAGTSSGQTGIISVTGQISGWESDGTPIVTDTSLSWARDNLGRPVDTLFNAWKRRNPDSTTAFISGKAWVADMFRGHDADVIVTGDDHPGYVPRPRLHSYCDPETDPDRRCDPESVTQRLNPLAVAMQGMPGQFPCDAWTVDAALRVFARENPGMAYILLAQADDTGHAIGAAWDLSLNMPGDPNRRRIGCSNSTGNNLVTSANPALYIEPILDAVRDVDHEFGRLMDGLEAAGVFDDSLVILLSDHGMVTHRRSPELTSADMLAATDYYQLLLDAGVCSEETAVAFGGSSLGSVYWRTGKETVAAAKAVLEAHLAVDPFTGMADCPWWVIDRDDMKYGKAGVSLPGELYHHWFVETDREQTVVWPDLLLLAKNGWELPAYGALGNIGITLPQTWLGPLYAFIGGHGSLDTQPIVMAISTPGGTPKWLERPTRIGDLAVTSARMLGLDLLSTTVGQDLSGDLS